MAKSPTARVFFCSPKGEQKKTREVSAANDERPKKRTKVEQEICGNKGSKKTGCFAMSPTEVFMKKLFFLLLTSIFITSSACALNTANANADKGETSDMKIWIQITSDYSNFEKYGPIGTSLPRNDTQITTTAGDIILYQGNQIAVYYDTNSWNFTRLGKVDGVTQAELKTILGKGDVTAVFSVME